MVNAAAWSEPMAAISIQFRGYGHQIVIGNSGLMLTFKVNAQHLEAALGKQAAKELLESRGVGVIGSVTRAAAELSANPVCRLVVSLGTAILALSEIQLRLGLKRRQTFCENYLRPALQPRLHTSVFMDIAPLAGRGVMLGLRGSF